MFVLLAGLACSDNQPPAEIPDPIPADFDRQAMFEHLGSELIVPTLTAFADRARALEAASSSTTAEAGDMRAVQQSWRDAMSAWQRAEVLQIGPAGREDTFRGGRGLRVGIYSWPTATPCKIDRNLVDRSYEDPAFLTSAPVDAYGLDTAEYLAFRDDEGNECASRDPINQGPWQALDAAALYSRRLAYLRVIARDLSERADALRDAWTGGFAEQLETAGGGSAVYPEGRDALDDLFISIFYIELRVKDVKLALPTGLSADCPATTCPHLVESPWAGHSKESLRVNLQAARDLLTGVGTSGLGLNALLEAKGAGALASAMVLEIDAALQAVDAIDGRLRDAVSADNAAVLAVHARVKAFTDKLKSQLVTVLGTRVPNEGAGDND